MIEDVKDRAAAAPAPAQTRLLTKEQKQYLVVLQSLQKKKQNLEAAIAAISGLVDDFEHLERVDTSVDQVAEPPVRLTDALKAILEETGRPMRNSEIKRLLRERRYQSDAANLDVAIIQSLNRMCTAGVAVKVGRGLWAFRTGRPSPKGHSSARA